MTLQPLIELLSNIPNSYRLLYIELWGSDVEDLVVLEKNKELIIVSSYAPDLSIWMEDGFKENTELNEKIKG